MQQNNKERPGFVNSKYAFTGRKKTVNGHVLHRIRAIRDIGHIKAGTIGGYIESTKNLSTGGDCWVGEDAMVYGPVEVLGSAVIKGEAIVSGPVKISGFTKISGNVKITGTDDNIWHDDRYYEILIWGSTNITGDCQISGKNIRIQDSSLDGTIIIGDNTHINRQCQVSGNVNLKGAKVNNTTISAQSGEKISVVDTQIEHSTITGSQTIEKESLISCKTIN